MLQYTNLLKEPYLSIIPFCQVTSLGRNQDYSLLSTEIMICVNFPLS